MAEGDKDAPLDLPEFRRAIHKLAVARREALNAYVKQAEQLAVRTGEYEREKSIAFLRLKNSGVTVTEAENTVKGQDTVVVAAIRRDKEAALLRGKLEEIAGIDAERSSLHRLADWSMRAG